MKSVNWKDTAELFGIVAIVLSLIFLGLQMRQDQVISRAELTSHTFDLMLGFNQSLFDESFAVTYAKMMETPEELDAGEMIRIDSLLNSVILSYSRECYLVERGIFEECTRILSASANRYFGNKYARSWLQQRKNRINSRIFDQLEDHLTNIESR